MIYEKQSETGEAVTLSELKQHLRILHNEQDTFLQKLIYAAKESAKQKVNVIPTTATYQFKVKEFKSTVFPVKPIVSISSVKYINTDGTEVTLDSTDYEFVKRFPRARDKIIFYNEYNVHENTEYPIIITANTGYSETPADIKAAILLIAGRLYENPENPVEQKITAADTLLRAYKY